MLLVPVVDGFNWRRPPLLTLALILLNCLVFLLYQSGDSERQQRVASAYFTSSLPTIELPLYAAYLRSTRPKRYADLAQESGRERLLMSMQSDEAFMRELRAEHVVTPEHPRHAEWKAERARIDALEDQLSYRRFGFAPAEPEPMTLVTSIFLHRDLLHLAGNMVFLFVLGVAAERALGASWYGLLYLLGGLAGNVLDLVIQPHSMVPTVSASGAIAALLGFFTVVFGPRRVNFFYWMLFVFGFKALRGIVLLPIWFSWEVLQYAIATRSDVDYMTHAGGLIAGALFGFVALKRLGASTRGEAFHLPRDQEAVDQAEYERARALAGNLDFKAASAVFARLAERFPHEIELLKQWHRVARTDPGSDDYHRVVSKILALPQAGGTLHELQRPVFTEYLENGPRPLRVELPALANIGLIFARTGDVAAAEQAADALFKQAPGDPLLVLLWDALAHALAAIPGDEASAAKAKRYRALISAQAKVVGNVRLA